MKNFKGIVKSITGYGLVVTLLITIISILAILGGGIMRLFGFRYNSVGSVILYFTIVAVVGFPLEIIIKAVPKALNLLLKIDRKIERVLFILMDTLGTGITMAIVDYFMESVSASDLSILVISFIIAILSLDKGDD
ncbi:hypothetical protein [Clostridium tertium]|uniref:Regulatory protein YrvL n=1 Tax=Clostridium tertium TaxID=1559 RepID=A0A6N3E4A4_9CLOT